MHIGIIGLGVYVPENYMTYKDISQITGIPENVVRDKMGIVKKPIPSQKDTTSFMGIMAAKEAIENAGISPGEIDVVIWNGAQHKDYPNWLAGVKVAYEIGAFNSWSFDMEAMCGSMIVGMEVAKSLMMANSDINTVLLVSGYRNVDMINYNHKPTSFMFDVGAGGSAVILKKNARKNVVFSTHSIVDGSFSEDVIVPVFGSKKWPPKREDVENFYFHIYQPDVFKEKLSKVTLSNFYDVIDKALEKSGFTRKDIGYLAILHIKRSAHIEVLKTLKLSENQTTYLENYGHIGQNDQIISIVEGLSSGKIKNGTLIVMVGAGVGWTWNAGVIKWGDYRE
ncbi:3-oxoacyl-ACP synthase [Thermosipho ferrireducens]|uniref:3-oxoacyl-ACP synthase n=1 Tax=Thermosipho ferrireducens TaxID=2571116 RepID=A0ABX7S6C8_9BACT|nr:3-oxoacyl-ACP synthase [Thermosipho ferrireducens]QTA37433.1 3-oxoacyl-ACP synthase [Thermosipho ferrireducens]